MASTPKNPFDGGGSIQGEPNKTIAPRVPAYDGGQFARDSMTPEEIQVSYDRYNDEIPSDRTSHGNATPEHSNPSYTGRQFSDDWDGGYKNYGVTVGPPEKAGAVTINPNRAVRGDES